jgi:hypothetical protein
MARFVIVEAHDTLNRIRSCAGGFARSSQLSLPRPGMPHSLQALHDAEVHVEAPCLDWPIAG